MSLFSDKTVLVTGATGLLGSHLVHALMDMDHVNVIALSRDEKKLQISFSQYIGTQNFRYIAADVSHLSEEDIPPADYVFHAASPISGRTINDTPLDVIAPNLNGTIALLELLKSQKKTKKKSGRFILFSSATVYGGAEEIDRTVSEDDTDFTDRLASPGAPYSQSKRMSEVIAQAYHKQFGVDIVIVRLSYVYGNTLFPPNTAFYEFLFKAIEGKNLILSRSNIPRRDNIYVDDAVSGILCVGTQGKSGEAYNVSSGKELENFAAIDEMAKVMAAEAGHLFHHKIQVKYKTTLSEKRKGGIILDNAKITSLGWHLHTSLTDGIRLSMLPYYKESQIIE